VVGNPFEDESGRYYALVNSKGQYSLWPVFADIPAGWAVAYGDAERQPCIEFIDEHWNDMRPGSN